MDIAKESAARKLQAHFMAKPRMAVTETCERETAAQF
jgi:hypothetical protein